MRVTYFGILRAATSWSKVCRELLRALIARGLAVNIYERKGFLYRPDMALPPALEDRIDQRFCGDIALTFEHPATYRYLRGQYKVGMLTYESTVVPPHWVAGINDQLDLLLVPSTFCRSLFSRAGVPEEKIAVLPHGFDPLVYHPGGETLPLQTDKRVVLLAVTSPHKREGIDQLLEAYSAAFTADDDICLVIKSNYLPGAKSKPFEYSDLAGLIAEHQRPAHPTVLHLTEFLSETEMARLYRSADGLISATRGEGFGMTFLEALACGVRVAVTGWGGQLDFLHQRNAILLDYTLSPADEVQYDCRSPEAQIARADTAGLIDAMGAFTQQSTSPIDLARTVAPFTWDRIAGQLIELLEKRMDG